MEQGVIAQDYTKRLKRNVKMGEWNDNILFLGGFILAGAAAIGGVITYLISKIRWASLNYQLDMEYGKRNPWGIFDTLPCRLSWLTEIPNRTKLKVSQK